MHFHSTMILLYLTISSQVEDSRDDREEAVYSSHYNRKSSKSWIYRNSLTK